MAIFHTHCQIIGKSGGRSAVAAAAYRSASKMVEYVFDNDTGITIEHIWDYRKKGGVVFSQIFAPQYAPSWVYEREQLWNKVSTKEKRKDGRLAREFDIALPLELSKEQNVNLIKELANECFVKHGMVADVNFHLDNPENPHAHIMLTMRDLVKIKEGVIEFGLKNREWNHKTFLEEVRSKTANIINKHLELHGFTARVSHLSHKERGIDLEPTMHVGPAGKHMDIAERKVLNQEIIKNNARRICANPELILDKLSINNPVFTKEEIASALSKTLLEVRGEEGGVTGTLENNDNIELLNKDFSEEFLITYNRVISSEKLTLVVKEDLKGRTLYALTKRIELEKRFKEKIHILNDRENHCLNINEEELEKLTLQEKLKSTLSVSTNKVKEQANKLLDTEFKLHKKISFSDQQKSALLSILNGKDISVLEGIPGAGKTFIQQQIARIYKNAGYKVIGLAQSSSAALQLESDAGIKSKNASLWRKEWQEAKGEKFELILRSDYYNESKYQNNSNVLDKKTVVIVDEASMGELANMDYLLGEIIKGNSKVIFIGDNNQYPAVGMAGALKKSVDICGSAKLTEVRRQQNPLHAEATLLMSEYRVAEALEIYKNDNSLEAFNSNEGLVKTLVDDYLNDYIQIADKLKRDDIANIKSVGICAHTNKTVNELNNEIRGKLKQAGIIKGEGQVIKVGNKRIELTRGEQIIFETNDNRLGIFNGEVGTVLKVRKSDQEGRGKIKVLVNKADGSKRVVTIKTDRDKYITINYGYAFTGYKVQGGTYDKVKIRYETVAGYEAFNVMISRHKEEVKIYVNKKELEDVVYKRLENDPLQARAEFNIQSEKELWMTGLNIAVSKRANLSFTGDYEKQYLTKEGKQIKTYIEKQNNLVKLLREISNWQRKEQNIRGYRPAIWEHDSWKLATDYKASRDSIARVICGNYSAFKDLIIQLELNYETIRRHAGISEYQYRVKDTETSIVFNQHYNELMRLCLELKSFGKFDTKGEEVSNEKQSLLINNFNNCYQKLSLDIGETNLEIKSLEEEINNITKERLKLEAEISNKEQILTRLTPEFVRRIYKDSPAKVLTKWQAFANQNGLKLSLEMVQKNPKLIGDLKGIGFGKWLGLNSERIDAIANIELLGVRLEEFTQSKEEIAKAEKLIAEGDFINREAGLRNRKLQLSLLLPNKYEQGFIDDVENVLTKIKNNQNIDSTINLFQEFINREEFEDAIHEYFNFKQKDLIEEAIIEQPEPDIKDNNIVDKAKEDFSIIIEAENKSDKESTIKEDIQLEDKIKESVNLPPDKQNQKEVNLRNNNYRKERPLTYKEIKEALTQKDYERIFEIYAHQINRDGKIQKKGRQISCGSLGMNLLDGRWNRFSTGQGGDIFHFVEEAARVGKREALEIVAEITGIRRDNVIDFDSYRQKKDEKEEAIEEAKKPSDNWEAYKIIPENAPTFSPEKHLTYFLKKNNVAAKYVYKNEQGQLLGFCLRMESKEEGKKQVLPVSYCYNEALKKSSWRFKGFMDGTNKPIYGAEKINQDLKPILIVEGEKAADKAQELLPDYTVLSWLGGCKAAGNVNWGKLKGRNVTIWPDNDNPGFEAASIIADKINKANRFIGLVSIINPKELNFPEKWDLGDEIPEGLTLEDIKQKISNEQNKLKSTNHVREVENELQKQYEHDEQFLNKAQTILWRERSTGNNLNQAQVVNKLEQYKFLESKITSSESLYYVKYSQMRGIAEFEHEFLKINNPLLQETLIALAKNTESKIKDNPEISELIDNLQTEYNLKSKNIGLQYLNNDKYQHFENLLSGNHDKQELFKTLVNDFALLHKEQLGFSCLNSIYFKQLCETIYYEVSNYRKINGKISNKLENDDKLKIVDNLYNKTSNKVWWEKICNQQVALTNELRKNEEKKIDISLNTYSKQLNDIHKLQPDFDLEAFKTELLNYNDKGRADKIQSLWIIVFKKEVLSELDKINQKKQAAKTVDEVIKALDKEKEYCLKIHRNYWEAANYFKYKEKNNQIQRNYATFKSHPEVLNSLKIEAENVERFKIWPTDKILQEIKSASYIKPARDKLFRNCQEYFIKEVKMNLEKLEKQQMVKEGQIYFKTKKDYLEHKLSDQNIAGRYLKNTIIEKQLNEIHKLDKQKHIELIKEKELDFFKSR